MAIGHTFKTVELTLLDKLRQLHWPFICVVLLVALLGYGMLYSAGGGSHTPWAWRHAVRFGVGFGVMLVIALIDLRLWFRLAYVIYLAALVGLIAVEVVGSINMGAQRWINLGFFQLQPSEVMKIALVLALARYFHGVFLDDIGQPVRLVVPLTLVIVPALLVLRQPDLGTSVMLIAGGGALFFCAGVRLWKFAVVIGGVGAALPVLWSQLHDYQKQRVLTFLDPERDPLGSGYHIIQSKIALGSGGVWGKGFLRGSQSQLSFLPEKQTDFVFTMLGEEAGLIGALFLLFLFVILIGYGFIFAVRARSQFARLVAIGVAVTFFLYVFINVAMVTGLIPVVGVPLPMISYGGTAMMTILVGFGLMLSVDLHGDIQVPRFLADDR
ncbi:MAG: rod shape-determining protein RodA [Geminicoccaceae bacterium]|nr:rod shape-determining protein RodA [Geminicoccaceae bacterium]